MRRYYMRIEWFQEMYKEFKNNKYLFGLTGDLGYIGWDKIRDAFPKRFVNCGAAEEAMLDIAVGIAQSGMIPVVYSITPFLIYRPFEVLRTYINHEKIPVKLFGAGRDKDYLDDGISHWAHDVKPVLDTLPNIKQYYPKDTEEMLKLLPQVLVSKDPIFMSLTR